MHLTGLQKQALFKEGYVRIPGVIPGLMVRDALKAINHSVGQGIPREEILTYQSQSFCPELTRESVITDLYSRTPAAALAESAIGAGRIMPAGSGQIALRFPGMHDLPPRPSPHIDGIHSPHNGVPKGTIQGFTALACVLLSELKTDFAGNFTVWPGTHLQYAAHFKEHTPQDLLNGMPAISMPLPVQIHGEPGDLVLAHYLLAHSVAANISHGIRYAIFFRLSHIDHAEKQWEAMVDPWLEWEGMREVVERNKT